MANRTNSPAHELREALGQIPANNITPFQRLKVELLLEIYSQNAVIIRKQTQILDALHRQNRPVAQPLTIDSEKR